MVCSFFRRPWEKWGLKKNISIAKLCSIMELQHKTRWGKRGKVAPRFWFCSGGVSLFHSLHAVCYCVWKWRTEILFWARQGFVLLTPVLLHLCYTPFVLRHVYELLGNLLRFQCRGLKLLVPHPCLLWFAFRVTASVGRSVRYRCGGARLSRSPQLLSPCPGAGAGSARCWLGLAEPTKTCWELQRLSVPGDLTGGSLFVGSRYSFTP